MAGTGCGIVPPIAKHYPHRLSPEAEAQIVALRRQTGWGPRALSAALGRPASTIWRVLKRYDCSRAQRQPRPPANRYEYAAVGELVHLDIKKLGRFWQVGKRILNDGEEPQRRRRLDICARRRRRPLPPRHRRAATKRARRRTAPAFAERLIAAYAEQGTPIQRHPDRQRRRLPLPRLPRPARPATASATSAPGPTRPGPTAKPKPSSASCNANGPTASSTHPATHRAKALPGWTRWYNNHRPHGGIDGHPPISRVSHAARSYS